MILKQGKRTVLTAQDPKYKRGLVVQYNKDGSYDMEYWFDKASDIYPVEVTVDGKSVKKDAKKVSMLYHPELGYIEKPLQDTQSTNILKYYLIGACFLYLYKRSK